MDWLLQALASQILWEVLLMLGVGAGLTYLRKKLPEYANSALYGLAGATCVAVLWFTFTGRSPLAKELSPTTPENVEANIRTWCDYWGFGVQKQSNPAFYFIDLVSLATSDRQFRISRSKEHDRYLQFELSFPVTLDQSSVLGKLSKERATRIRNEVELEIAKSRIGFMFLRSQPSDLIQGLILQKLVPISPSLTQDAFIDDVSELDLATTVATRSLELAIEHNKN